MLAVGEEEGGDCKIKSSCSGLHRRLSWNNSQTFLFPPECTQTVGDTGGHQIPLTAFCSAVRITHEDNRGLKRWSIKVIERMPKPAQTGQRNLKNTFICQRLSTQNTKFKFQLTCGLERRRRWILRPSQAELHGGRRMMESFVFWQLGCLQI